MDFYTNGLKELISDLKRNNRVELLMEKIPIRHTSDKKIIKEIGYINEEFHVDYKNFLFDVYDMFGGIQLHWNYLTLDGVNSGGEIHFLNLNQCLYSDFDLSISGIDENEKKLLSAFCPFDDHPRAGDGIMAGFIIKEGQHHPEIWLYDNGTVNKLQLDFSQYLNYLIATGGAYYWQYLFVDKSVFDNNDFLKEQIVRLKNTLMEIFLDKLNDEVKKRIDLILK